MENFLTNVHRRAREEGVEHEVQEILHSLISVKRSGRLPKGKAHMFITLHKAGYVKVIEHKKEPSTLELTQKGSKLIGYII